jgi:aminoglycoside phosphotransferase (APT) family kinase protein
LALLHSKPVPGDKQKLGFYPRQITRLGSVSRKQALVPQTPRLPDLDRMLDWFEKNAVQDACSIIHGDYKMDNLVSSLYIFYSFCLYRSCPFIALDVRQRSAGYT